MSKTGISIWRFTSTAAVVVALVAATAVAMRVVENRPLELAASSISAPTITREPNVPVDDQVAKFRLSHSDKKAMFECALQQNDGAIAYSSCGANPRYQNLGQFDYCFYARAIVNGVRSDPAKFCWTNYTPATFGIKGGLTASQLLFPGKPGEKIDLVFENPNNQDIKVLEVIVTVANATTKAGQPNPQCVGTDNLSVTKQLTQQVTVPKNATRSLSQLGVPPAAWPVVTFLNLSTNQDACKATSFTLTFAGTASK